MSDMSYLVVNTVFFVELYFCTSPNGCTKCAFHVNFNKYGWYSN